MELPCARFAATFEVVEPKSLLLCAVSTVSVTVPSRLTFTLEAASHLSTFLQCRDSGLRHLRSRGLQHREFLCLVNVTRVVLHQVLNPPGFSLELPSLSEMELPCARFAATFEVVEPKSLLLCAISTVFITVPSRLILTLSLASYFCTFLQYRDSGLRHLRNESWCSTVGSFSALLR